MFVYVCVFVAFMLCCRHCWQSEGSEGMAVTSLRVLYDYVPGPGMDGNVTHTHTYTYTFTVLCCLGLFILSFCVRVVLCLFVSLSLCLFVSLSLCLSVTASVSISISISVSLFHLVHTDTHTHTHAHAHADELPAREGDVLQGLSFEQGWWRAALNGRVGLFPGNYAEVGRHTSAAALPLPARHTSPSFPVTEN